MDLAQTVAAAVAILAGLCIVALVLITKLLLAIAPNLEENEGKPRGPHG